MARYAVGIDLGTSNTVLAFAALAGGPDGAAGPVTLFEVEQLVAPGEVAALALLPSVRYQGGPGELAPADLQLPWPAAANASAADAGAAVIGSLARKLGAQAPGRLVASAKSWLSHPGVDRMAPILPWGAGPDVAKVSPVDASASYLAHLRAAWNTRFPDDPLEQQDLVLTVPASFDEAARALTLAAARAAGLPAVRLLEEPQAVFYDWLGRHRANLAADLAATRLVLVCDVGGGTTDLSLIKVEWNAGQSVITRIGVGKHLMLGGDNMDMALAHLAEARLAGAAEGGAKGRAEPLSAARLAQLVERCRVAKEQLLAADAPEQVSLTMLGAGSRLVGGARSISLARSEVEALIVDGFFPAIGAAAPLLAGRGGIVEFGLPYARDAAITRHIGEFLRRHADAIRATLGDTPGDALAIPDTLLLNGGVFRAGALARRLEHTLGQWRGAPLRVLHNDNPDLAVARGAVAYALAGTGQGAAPKIGGGAARSYFLLLDQQGKPGAQRAMCILPRASEAGDELRLDAHNFALRVGAPVRFHLFTSTADAAGRAPFALGELVDLGQGDYARLPPLEMVVRHQGSAGTPTRREVPVQLATSLTEVGTLEMHCVSIDDPAQRWLLEFDLRQPGAQDSDQALPGDDGTRAAQGLAQAMAQALPHIERIFGSKAQQVAPKEVRQLRARLEQVLGERAIWSTPLLRQVVDALLARARARRRSPEHERAWLNLAGFCLRPGYGFALDSWRIEQLWPLFDAGLAHRADKQAQAEWWTLWRRVAGGLDGDQQRRLLDDFAFNLQANQQGEGDDGTVVRGSDDDMLRLGASLERLPPAYKAEVGQWLLGRLDGPGAALALWALGRIGARQPFYGNLEDLVPPDVVAGWVDTILTLDWRRIEPAGFAAAYLARMTGDRARDLPQMLRERVAARLRQVDAPALWLRMVSEVMVLDDATQQRVFGEALPPGLRLIT